MDDILEEIKNLLAKRFEGFYDKRMITQPQDYYFHKRYANKLGIIIKVTIKPKHQPVIRTVVKKKKGICLELKKTSVISGWPWVLEQKIRILEKIVNEAPKCSECNIFQFPSEAKNSQTGTKYVSYYCPICSKRTNTQYGIGLKTELHRLLK